MNKGGAYLNKKRWLLLMTTLLITLSTLVVVLIIEGTGIREKSQVKLMPSEIDWLKTHGSLVYAADNNAPPLRYVDDSDGQYKGVVVDYVNLLSLQLGTSIEVHPLLWEDALDQLSQGQSDLCDMFSSEERSKYFEFTNPIYNLRAVVVTRDQRETLKDLETLHFATQEGDYVNEYLLTHYPNMKITTVPDASHALDLLVEGKVDAVAGDEPVILYYLKDKNNTKFLHVVEETLYDNEVVFAVPKDKKILVSIINQGIAAIEGTDQLERIQQKWFGISTPLVQEGDKSWITRVTILIFSIFGFIVLSLFLWNKSLQNEVERRTSEVINSKNDLQITFDGMSEYIALTDVNLHIININKSYLDFLCVSKSKVINAYYEQIVDWFESDKIKDMIHDVMASKESLTKELKCFNSYYIVKIYPLNDAFGVLKNLLIVIQDITTDKLTETKLLQSSKMAAVGQLAAGMAHEIRNPLGIIRNQSYILESRFDQALAKRSFDLLNSAVERASNIIDNLLEFSRLSSDEKRYIHLEQFIQKILDLEDKRMMKKNIKSSLSCSPDIEILSNIESLKHILINLISNAIDAIDQDGEIDIFVIEFEEDVRIQVIDTGVGIAADQVDRIFDPFYTTKSIGKGTGLGLYISYNEVKKLGGDISVSGTDDKRTVFEVRLPLLKE